MNDLNQATSYFDIQPIILIKFILILFLVIGLILIFKKGKPWIFLLITGLLSALSYAVLINDSELMFGGLLGDEVTIAAMYNTFAHQGMLSDFGYSSLPPFYPPLFFWIFSFVGRIFDWNGVLIAKFASFISILIFPIVTYAIQRLYWRTNKELNRSPGIIAAFLAPLLIFVLIEPTSVFGKPYELIAAMATIFWAVFLLIETARQQWNWKKVFIFGLTGGIIFLIYYLWIIFAAIAILLAGMWVEKRFQWRFYKRLMQIALVCGVVGLPYLGPLVTSFLIHGAENWQAALFTLKGLTWQMPMFITISWQNILLLGGLVTLIIYRNHVYVRPLLFLFISAYIWWFMGLVTLYFFQVPIQEFKGFFFYSHTIIAIALAFGIEQLWHSASSKYIHQQWQTPVMLIALLFLSTNLIFGSYIDDPIVQQQVIKKPAVREEIVPLIQYLENDPNSSEKLTLQSGIVELSVFATINNFIYFNQHNNHPAAGFSLRRSYVKMLSRARNAEEFYALSQNTPYGKVERLIFFHEQNKYYVFLHLDEPMIGIKEEVIEIPDYLITGKYFKKVYDKAGFVIWERI